MATKNHEDEVLQKAIRGDRNSLQCMVNMYKDLAYTIAVRVVQNHEDAEEVVQDSFLKAFKSLPSFRNESKFSTWLYRIVYNTSLSKISTKKISTQYLNQQLKEQLIDSSNLEWELLENTERKKFINLALNQLPQDDRLVLTLYYIGEKSITEICDIMNKNKSAIKMRLLRGRKQMETELELLLNNEVKNLL